MMSIGLPSAATLPRPPRLIIMAGGTGGHIMPGLAIAERMRARGWDVQWLGNPDALEGELVPRQGIELLPLRFRGWRGRRLRPLLALPFTMLAACWRAHRHLRRQRPDLVLGLGGYVALPGGLMAALGRIPLVIHEQNSIAGLTNRVLARFARQVLAGFSDAFGSRANVQVTGNPLREAFQDLPAPAARYSERSGPLSVLVVGGSLGAQALNALLPQAIAKLPESARPRIVHQAGPRHLDALRADYQQRGVTAECVPFLDDMAQAMAQADLVICRAGAMTVSEVAAVGVAALFVPYPFATGDHQTANAQVLARIDAGFCQAQRQLNPDSLSQWLSTQNRQTLSEVAVRARAVAKRDACAHIVQVCEQWLPRAAAAGAPTP